MKVSARALAVIQRGMQRYQAILSLLIHDGEPLKRMENLQDVNNRYPAILAEVRVNPAEQFSAEAVRVIQGCPEWLHTRRVARLG